MCKRWHVVVAVLLSFCYSSRADVTGSILGTVRDTTDAVVPKAVVVVTNVETNLSKQTARTNRVNSVFSRCPSANID